MQLKTLNDQNQYEANRRTSCLVLPQDSVCDEWDDSQENEAEDRNKTDLKIIRN